VYASSPNPSPCKKSQKSALQTLHVHYLFIGVLTFEIFYQCIHHRRNHRVEASIGAAITEISAIGSFFPLLFMAGVSVLSISMDWMHALAQKSFVYMYVCMYVYMYICVDFLERSLWHNVYEVVCMRGFMYVYIYTCVCVSIFTASPAWDCQRHFCGYTVYAVCVCGSMYTYT